LDAASLLADMEQLEQEGASFQNKQRQDVHIRYLGPVIASLVMAVLLAALTTLMVWAWRTDPGNAPPLWVFLALLALPAVVTGGVLLALFQRIREIAKGEFDDAKQY